MKKYLPIILATLIVFGGGAAIALVKLGGSDKPSAESRVQTYLVRNASKAVTSIDVKQCRDVSKEAGAPAGTTALACAVDVKTTQGDGCVGVVYAYDAKQEGVIDTPVAIDPKNCSS